VKKNAREKTCVSERDLTTDGGVHRKSNQDCRLSGMCAELWNLASCCK